MFGQSDKTPFNRFRGLAGLPEGRQGRPGAKEESREGRRRKLTESGRGTAGRAELQHLLAPLYPAARASSRDWKHTQFSEKMRRA